MSLCFHICCNLKNLTSSAAGELMFCMLFQQKLIHPTHLLNSSASLCLTCSLYTWIAHITDISTLQHFSFSP